MSSRKSTVTRRRLIQSSQVECNLTRSQQGELEIYGDKDKWSWFSNKIKVRGWTSVKAHSGAKTCEWKKIWTCWEPLLFLKSSINSINWVFKCTIWWFISHLRYGKSVNAKYCPIHDYLVLTIDMIICGIYTWYLEL